ncbi:uncharacterized protein MELLADRAFT_104051 [Melampsora larici-populina 98AG31]|uniref:Uncharacterized protein n=1 Tax=Melampsora larici-populina (strain 98AG31 / pathotype 3-4-7) TaxID=747676 RepID=F4RDE1_MELLP|nr:uncharacterized protein MELLADRAFT_104051 [Melampsora larici-populina 98AG31]EGG09387.1 hypothetical protein MELLADRAFT_104051 [Melampsora larici-populina 98AG31]
MNPLFPLHPLTPQATNSAGLLNSNKSAQFPPRHIEGQCAHQWESPQNLGHMVFYHQASRCKYKRIFIDLDELEHIRTYATMNKYMAFAGVRGPKIDTAVKLLSEHDIEQFYAFLYPE